MTELETRDVLLLDWDYSHVFGAHTEIEFVERSKLLAGCVEMGVLVSCLAPGDSNFLSECRLDSYKLLMPTELMLDLALLTVGTDDFPLNRANDILKGIGFASVYGASEFGGITLLAARVTKDLMPYVVRLEADNAFSISSRASNIPAERHKIPFEMKHWTEASGVTEPLLPRLTFVDEGTLAARHRNPTAWHPEVLQVLLGEEVNLESLKMPTSPKGWAGVRERRQATTVLDNVIGND